jgi:protein-S-isoprenylcysteine O-methyltransferase Ste14
MSERFIQFTVASWLFLLAGLNGVGIAEIVLSGTGSGLDYAKILSKVCALLFLSLMAHLTLMRGSPINKAAGWWPRLSAVIGTNLAFFGILFLNGNAHLGAAIHLLSAALIAIGSLVCIYTLSYLGRSFSVMAEARRFIANGPYRVVRHPLYFAELIATTGVITLYCSWLAWAMLAVQFSFQIARMFNEEMVLRGTFPEYADYMQRTYRLIPGIW